MKIQPLFNRILAKKIQTEQQKSMGGIEILQEDEQVEKAQVLSLGSNAQNCGVNIGDTIFFEPHTTANLNFGTEELILICAEDILAIESKKNLQPTNSSQADTMNKKCNDELALNNVPKDSLERLVEENKEEVNLNG